MTVRELIEELNALPQDLPVVSSHKEILDVDLSDAAYVLDHGENTYSIGPAVILE